MREKNELIKKELFDKDALQNILNDYEGENGKDSTYYRAILQNLFFATLSVPIKERKYIKDTDAFPNKDYGNPYVFRFQDAFVNPKENLKLFKDIPFLNGGLFECLDFVPKPEESNRKETRLDGFSTKKNKQAQVPDFLFWGRHTGIDLSGELDNPRKKNVSIHGIIDLLNNYKFTIEENTPIEEEIALDPELLGKVFENLLAQL
jgi:adenine-specific DNA-methyltransferase